ncbi:MAG: PepSY domain-containing protein [Rhodobacteraceae bacterium]|nr:MAG: PepSY domain-containing protein [Paracoccaceae bacterium]
MMNPVLRSLGAISLLIAVPFVAVAVELGQFVGTGAAAIAEAVRAEGWDVHEFERENGAIEVELRRGGERLEIEVDAATGAVVKLERKS